jgi:hypothetical protein
MACSSTARQPSCGIGQVLHVCFLIFIFWIIWYFGASQFFYCPTDIGVQPPSIDIAIDGSLTTGPEVTPQHKITPFQPVTSPLPYSSRSVTAGQSSCGIYPSIPCLLLVLYFVSEMLLRSITIFVLSSRFWCSTSIIWSRNCWVSSGCFRGNSCVQNCSLPTTKVSIGMRLKRCYF